MDTLHNPAIQEAKEALRLAVKLADIATDWHLDEVEIDGEVVSVYDLMVLFDEAHKRLDKLFT